MRVDLRHGDCRDVVAQLADANVDAVVTDPPYELGFMGRKWDASGIAYSVDLWREVLRVLKPGGHLLAFGGTRTYHRMACAIEDAGFEVRDSIHWVYGSGFPKGLDVSKAIDKAAGADRPVVGLNPNHRAVSGPAYVGVYAGGNTGSATLSAPATPEACQWSGWNVALKPAHEPIVVARRPLTGTVAENVLEWGTGALNVDGCRVGTTDNLNGGAYAKSGTDRTDGWHMKRGGAGEYQQPAGRFPPNLLFSHLPECGETECAEGCGVRELAEQSGVRTSGVPGVRRKPHETSSMSGRLGLTGKQETGYGDSGGASRFFPVFRYQAKAGRREREAGLREAVVRTGCAGEMPVDDNGKERDRFSKVAANTHPTVKPVDLMRWLVRLVTPPNGLVLDPFTGSGTTGVAALLEGFRFVGCEREAEYLAIAQARIAAAEAATATQQPTLFDLAGGA